MLSRPRGASKKNRWASNREAVLHIHSADACSLLCNHGTAAAWQVTDAILKKTRDIAIQGLTDYVSTSLLVEVKIRACAVEDADVGAKRARNHEIIKAMQLVLEELTALDNEAPFTPSASSVGSATG